MSDTHEQGICPKCGSDGLTYGDTKKQDIAIGYMYECESCGFIGIEWYNLNFTEHTDPDCAAVKPCEECKGFGWIEGVHNTKHNTIELQRCDSCRKYKTDREAAQAAIESTRQKTENQKKLFDDLLTVCRCLEADLTGACELFGDDVPDHWTITIGEAKDIFLRIKEEEKNNDHPGDRAENFTE